MLSIKKALLIVVVLLLVSTSIFFDLGRFLSFDSIKVQQQAFNAYTLEHPLLARGGYFAVYIVVAALSIPGAVVLTLLGGALFGFWWGLVLTSFASTLGALLAFLLSRFVLRDSVQLRFREQLTTVNDGVRREGAYYLFGLRLVPLFPFFMINLAMGLTTIKTITFYWVSQIGMLPGTAVYINAGTQLGTLESPAGIVTPRVLIAFALLALFPFVIKKAVSMIRARR